MPSPFSHKQTSLGCELFASTFVGSGHKDKAMSRQLLKKNKCFINSKAPLLINKLQLCSDIRHLFRVNGIWYVASICIFCKDKFILEQHKQLNFEQWNKNINEARGWITSHSPLQSLLCLNITVEDWSSGVELSLFFILFIFSFSLLLQTSESSGEQDRWSQQRSPSVMMVRRRHLRGLPASVSASSLLNSQRSREGEDLGNKMEWNENK